MFLRIYNQISILYTKILFRKRNVTFSSIRDSLGFPIVNTCPGSKIIIGKRFEIISSSFGNMLGINHPAILSTRKKYAEIIIGDDVGMSGGSITADQKITIGDRVLLGANVQIFDTDFHPINKTERRYSCNGRAKPVEIKNDVFIGTNCTILKGVTIGEYAVVGAGSVVTSNIPAHTIYVGNPAHFIRNIYES